MERVVSVVVWTHLKLTFYISLFIPVGNILPKIGRYAVSFNGVRISIWIGHVLALLF